MEETLERFLIAQNGKTIHGNTIYEQALKEIEEGKIDFECWIRYMFPQLKLSGTSKLTTFYGLNGHEEAKEYINHPILRERLIKATQIVLNNNKSVYEIFSPLGVMKVRACMLLFSSVSDILEFKKLKNKYCWK